MKLAPFAIFRKLAPLAVMATLVAGCGSDDVPITDSGLDGSGMTDSGGGMDSGGGTDSGAATVLHAGAYQVGKR